MDTWTSTIQVAADCLTCGRAADYAPSEVGRRNARRWARTHATENPGHHTVVEVTGGRSYLSGGAS